MIEVNHAFKGFGDITAVDDLSLTIKDKSVFGLIGTNGAGKSTLIRMITGIYDSDQGSIIVDGEEVFENEKVKRNIFLIPEEIYFLPNATPLSAAGYYRALYADFDLEKYQKLLNDFGLDAKRKIKTFSKGMKKQVSMLLGLCANTKYLVCDETFDGLDPVMRFAVKEHINREKENRGLTCVISSHNLRELEDVCSSIGLLHKGGILLSEELSNLKVNIHKIQCVFAPDTDASNLGEMNIIYTEKRGSLFTFTIEGDEEEIMSRFAAISPVFYEMIPLTLEEIFISKTKEVGYDVKSVTFENI
ncbi:MAG: ABC transporter ATP-binding protein [Lachnospiraceae bacterium]|nr:ABC transporter ATP-binding protein [Lachnospiraceae bacterium]